MTDITPGFTKPKGSHSVDIFMDWLEKQDNIPFHVRLRLKKRIKDAANQASADPTHPVVLPIESHGKTVLALKFFDDGSMIVGWPTDAKWYGTPKPAFVPPPEEEIK